MRIQKSAIISLIVWCVFSIVLNAQELTQVVRGQVVDAESQAPLAFASIVVITTDPALGIMTNDKGYFRLEEVPIGRHDIKVSFVGYETQMIPELMVSTGKEIVLSIKMKEEISELKEVVVKANTQKDKPLNSMSTVSARTFSVEEARRYAGGWDDPGRLVASFAGVTTDNSRDNTIIIRGNSPKGLLWRLEGIEIPNPNHFANLTTFGGGHNYACSILLLTSFFCILKLHFDEIIPIITPIIMLSNINKALGVFITQNHNLISTISVFCKAKITKSSDSKIIAIILNFIVKFFSKVQISK